MTFSGKESDCKVFDQIDSKKVFATSIFPINVRSHFNHLLILYIVTFFSKSYLKKDPA